MKNNSEPISLRITFLYEGNNVRMISRQKVKMTPFPSDPIHDAKGQAGFWYELKDAMGNILYRRAVPNPIKFAVEVRSDNTEHPLSWTNISDPRGSFVLLMPYFKEADKIVLFSSPLDIEKAGEPAKEMYRFGLSKDIEDKEDDL